MAWDAANTWMDESTVVRPKGILLKHLLGVDINKWNEIDVIILVKSRC